MQSTEDDNNDDEDENRDHELQLCVHCRFAMEYNAVFSNAMCERVFK